MISRPFARVGDKISCGGAILSGSPNMFVGGAARTVAPIQSEVPELPRGSVSLGVMAAKELGNDEADFDHAL